MQAPKKILVLLGHTDEESFVGALASQYEDGARRGGHEVRRLNVGKMVFDPVLYKGYKEVQPLEPDLESFQKDLVWAEHFVLFYPNWWGGMPAKLKGLFDRAFLPGFAFTYKTPRSLLWGKLLKGRSAHVFVTMDAPPRLSGFLLGNTTDAVQKSILKFVGFSPVRVTKIGSVKRMSDKKRNAIKKDLYSAGGRGE